jgi:hypothetical protein
MTDIQRLPGLASGQRVESGVVQFGDDWPGVFIRGDNAMTFAHVLRAALKLIPQTEWLVRSQLNGLQDDLQACCVGNTGWPLGGADEAKMWLERFDVRKQMLIDGGMLAKDADAQAAREIIAELRTEQ